MLYTATAAGEFEPTLPGAKLLETRLPRLFGPASPGERRIEKWLV